MPSLDIAKTIKLDHDNVRDLYQKFGNTTDKQQKKAIANTLIREMAVHGDAEELSIYKEYSRFGLGDEAEHNREEHAEVKRLVYEADTKNFESPDYDDLMAKAFKGFDKHAKEEEEQQLNQLVSKINPQENDKFARDFIQARQMAPTAPQCGGRAQKATGMSDGLTNKLAETMQGREFVALKHNHPSI